MSFETIKALHIIFMVSWFAGLFYSVRLFIYHVEAQEKETVEKNILTTQFEVMEKKLWWIITTPAMILTVVFGSWMLILNSAYLQFGWMHVKITFVILLVIYHFICQKILLDFKKGVFKWTSSKLRIWNEVATLFLVAIIFIVVLRYQDTYDWLKATLVFIAIAIGLMLGIKSYKMLRKKN